MQLVHISNIKIKPDRQRQHFEPEAMVELMNSIKSIGLLQAVVVRHESDGVYLVAGERRLKAMNDLHNLGIPFTYAANSIEVYDIPTVSLGELDELEAEEAELDENIKRQNLTWQEKAAATSRLHSLRNKQAGLNEETHSIADTTEELTGHRGGSYQATIRKSLVIAKHLDNPLVKNAKTVDEAFKLLKKDQTREANIKLAAEVGMSCLADKHLVLNMDCLDYMRDEANWDKFDVILTDPPYGMNAQNFQDANGKLTAINHTYDDSPESFALLMEQWCHLSWNVAKEQAHCYLFCDIDNFHRLKLWMTRAGWYVFRTPLIHHKPGSGRVPLPDQGPRRQYEFILYAIKGKKQVTHIYPDVISSSADESTGHGAQKPVELFQNLLQRSVKPGDQVLDSFAGSGTIIEACHTFSCQAVAIELLPENFALCLQRLDRLKREG